MTSNHRSQVLFDGLTVNETYADVAGSAYDPQTDEFAVVAMKA